MKSEFKKEILSWDGKSAEDIGQVYDRYNQVPDFSERTIELIFEPACQDGATWLVKKYLETGNNLDSKEIRKIYKGLDILESWESKLHILQFMQFLPIPSTAKKLVETFLRQCLMSTNKFVRAWSYSGFYELASQHHMYKDEVRELINLALRDEAASVKARIRRLQKLPDYWV